VRPAFALAERGLIGDSLIRLGIRRLVSQRLREQQVGGVEAQRERQRTLIAAMRASPIALHVDTANRQHYEVPAEFYEHVLGPRRKYSACLWPAGVTELTDAEEAMLSLTAARAQIEDGHTILDLGWGWGAFALWAAERFPRCRIFALSTSQAQRAYIEAQASHLRLADRLQVSTGDVSTFVPDERFDSVGIVDADARDAAGRARRGRRKVARLRGAGDCARSELRGERRAPPARTFACGASSHTVAVRLGGSRVGPAAHGACARARPDPPRKSAFNGDYPANVIYKESDRLSGRQPIEFVQAARPVVIIDEPQSVDATDKAQEAIKALTPL
jgi:hypothetical protein